MLYPPVSYRRRATSYHLRGFAPDVIKAWGTWGRAPSFVGGEATHERGRLRRLRLRLVKMHASCCKSPTAMPQVNCSTPRDPFSPVWPDRQSDQAIAIELITRVSTMTCSLQRRRLLLRTLLVDRFARPIQSPLDAGFWSQDAARQITSRRRRCACDSVA